MLGFAHLFAPATEPMPWAPEEKEPKAWQRAGIEAALHDPAVGVQMYTLRYCFDKKWVPLFPISTARWLRWLSDDQWDWLAVRAVAQLGAQMPPEVQRTLARLQSERAGEDSVALEAARALEQTGAAMVPEVQQAELACLRMGENYEQYQVCARKALGGMGAAMPPATAQALLGLMLGAQIPSATKYHAAEALALLGAHMPPQVREAMLGVLLDAHADMRLRYTAAEAMGRLGPQMPPQAQQFLISLLGDPTDKYLRHMAPEVLVALGSRMPPELPQVLVTAFDQACSQGVESDNASSFSFEVIKAFARMGPDMPLAVQQHFLALFLKTAHAARTDLPEGRRVPFSGITGGGAMLVLRAAGRSATPDVLHALLGEFENKAADRNTLGNISEFFQELAEAGSLPADIRRALLSVLQDESAQTKARNESALILAWLGKQATAEMKQTLLAHLRSSDTERCLTALRAMGILGPQMPPEAVPELLAFIHEAMAESARDSFADAGIPLRPGQRSPLLYTFGMEHAVPALGRLGAQMPPEAQAAMLAVLRSSHHGDGAQFPAAHALAAFGDKMPQRVQLSLLHGPAGNLRAWEAMDLTLGVSGIHPVSDALLADILARTYLGEPDDKRRAHLYLWLGRDATHLQALRWLGNASVEPELGNTPPHEILGLISRLWPHSAKHPALRQAMARRSSGIIATQVKTPPLDEATLKVLRA
ncbi:MAG: hypothetical protein B7Z37_28730, partial [Verrucomicrobia bacterium 12-59-8]